MREFFRGWKRKLGTIALIVSCLLTSVWLRSASRYDFVTIPIGKTFSLAFVSGEGLFTFTPLSEGWPADWKVFLVTPPADYPPLFKGERTAILFKQQIAMTKAMTLRAYQIDWAFRSFGVGYGLRPDGGRGSRLASVFEVPYWLIITPLTLLSAWLLLSKRKPPRSAASDDIALADRPANIDDGDSAAATNRVSRSNT